MTNTAHLVQQDRRNVTAMSGTWHRQPHPRPIWLLKGECTGTLGVSVYVVFLIKTEERMGCGGLCLFLPSFLSFTGGKNYHFLQKDKSPHPVSIPSVDHHPGT